MTNLQKRILTSLVIFPLTIFFILKGGYFLLWQLAYTEIFFVDKLWPDFNENDFNRIIIKFNKIKRNFGKI